MRIRITISSMVAMVAVILLASLTTPTMVSAVPGCPPGEPCPPIPEPPPGAPLAPPSDFTITGKTDTSISFRWKDSTTNETSFRVYRRVPETGSERVYHVASFDTDGTGRLYSRTDEGLSAGRYCYRIKTANDHGESFPTREICTRVPLPPAAPTDLELTGVETRSISLRWRDNSTNEDRFTLERRLATESTWETVYTLWIRDHRDPPGSSGGLYSHTDSGLLDGTRYCYQVRAWNSGGSSSSEERCDSTLPLPKAPSDFQITRKTETSISLKWNDNATDEVRFQVFHSQIDKGCEGYYWSPPDDELGPHSGTGWMEWTHTGLDPNTRYCYFVRVYNAYGYRDSTTIAGKTKKEEDTPSPPSPSSAELAFNGSLILTPVFPDPYEPFTIKWIACNYGGSPTGSFKDIAQLDGGATYERSVSSIPAGSCYEKTVSHPGLPPGDHYWYVYLDAYNDVGEPNEGNNINYYGFGVD